MNRVLLLPAFTARLWARLRSPSRALLDIYLPVFLLFTLYYVWRINFWLIRAGSWERHAAFATNGRAAMIFLLLETLAFLVLLLTLPLTLELGLLTAAFLFFKKPTPPALRAYVPFRLAVIVPAHDQAARIASTVNSLRAAREHARHVGIRIVVIAHNCTDDTAARARAAGSEIRILDGAAGKDAALVFAFQTVPADGYLVIDADSAVDSAVLDRVQSLLASGVEALQCRYQATPARTLRACLGVIAFRAVNVLRPAARQRLGISSGILGNGFALHRSLLDRIPYSAFSLAEEVEYHLALVGAGVRVLYVDDVAVRSAITTIRSRHARSKAGRLSLAWSSWSRLLLQLLLGPPRLFEPALDIAGLPLPHQSVLLLIGVLLPFRPIRIYSAAALLVVAVHLLAAVLCGDGPAG